MKTTLAILGIFVATALVAGTVAVSQSYAFISFQNNKFGAQNNQNAGQAAGVGQSNYVGSGWSAVANSGAQTNQATVNQAISQAATNNCNGGFSC